MTGDLSPNDVDTLFNYVIGSFAYLPFVDKSTHIGLAQGGTLYDVPEPNPGIGNITVSAPWFNISCGFLEDLTANFSVEDSTWSLSSGNKSLMTIASTVPGVISTFAAPILYSTIPIVDSNNDTGGLVDLPLPMNTTVSSIQVFRCFLSLAHQIAFVDAQSRSAVALYPEFSKTLSVWHPVDLWATVATIGNLLIDQWATCLSYTPPSDVPLDPDSSDPVFFTLADVYLMQKFNLHSANQSSIDGTGLLHAIWLYRNHPELEDLLEQVEHPTKDNLRDAGMVRTRLVGPRRRAE
ncbi:hypothetical protein MVEN_02383300 [Mycena venus]|uniref:Uncharacterized protein n=1 Tax=Mycena venus TaxID=2733690 RepID=A0A8H7CDG8_9AGAR|nr:hypothetical protein MVEN_02383300 [Mycena venus]